MTPADLKNKGFIEMPDGSFQKPSRQFAQGQPETCNQNVVKTGASRVCEATLSETGGSGTVSGASLPVEAAMNLPNENHSQTSLAFVERGSSHAALEKAQAKAGHTGRFLVVVTSFRRRLLDEDNLCEKYHVDCCRYAGCIPSDAPGTTKIEVRQEKVRSKADERTEIEITELNP